MASHSKLPRKLHFCICNGNAKTTQMAIFLNCLIFNSFNEPKTIIRFNHQAKISDISCQWTKIVRAPSIWRAQFQVSGFKSEVWGSKSIHSQCLQPEAKWSDATMHARFTRVREFPGFLNYYSVWNPEFGNEHKKGGAAWLPLLSVQDHPDQEISWVAFLLMARLALRIPPAIRATNTVAAQKTMAITDNIVMNSNILSTSSRFQSRHYSGFTFSVFRLKAASLNLTSAPATRATTMVAATKTRAMTAIVSMNSIILITSSTLRTTASSFELV